MLPIARALIPDRRAEDAPIPGIAALSLRARLAIALRLFAGYCERRRVDHPAVGAYLDYFWWFVGMDGSTEAFGKWSAAEPPLVGAGLGWEWPEGFADHLAARGVPEPEFRRAVCSASEVLYGSLYGACDEPGSRRFVGELAALVHPHGVPFPDLRPFDGSGWADGHGWGRLVGPQELAAWRG